MPTTKEIEEKVRAEFHEKFDPQFYELVHLAEKGGGYGMAAAVLQEKIGKWIRDTALSTFSTSLAEEIGKKRLEPQPEHWGANLTQREVYNAAIEEVLSLLANRT